MPALFSAGKLGGRGERGETFVEYDPRRGIPQNMQQLSRLLISCILQVMG